MLAKWKCSEHAHVTICAGSCLLVYSFVAATMLDLFMMICGSRQMDTLLGRGIELYINMTELH